jgi:trk system potassium uptake protein TrkA
MRIVIVGAGEVGYHVADRLAKEQHDVVVIDVDRDRLDYVESHIDVSHQRGLVKVARVSNPDFYRDGEALRPGRYGVNVLINPDRELALETFRLLESTAATDLVLFAGGAAQLLGLTILEDAPVDGKTLREIVRKVGRRSILAVAVERDGETIIPDGDTVLRADDHVYAIAAEEEIPHALELCGYAQSKLRRVMIAGHSREAFYLARLLEQHGVDGTVPVSDPDMAQEFAERLERTLILHGDATEVELLEFEGASEADAFVAFTDEDETNIISSLLARDLGVKQTVTLVNRSDYLPLARRIGLDAAVSPRISAANAILQYVRRGSIRHVAVFKESDAEVISFEVAPDSPLVGVPLDHVDFPEHAILAAVVRDHRVIVPRGSDALQPGDEAVVFALADAVGTVTELFPS